MKGFKKSECQRPWVSVTQLKTHNSQFTTVPIPNRDTGIIQ